MEVETAQIIPRRMSLDSTDGGLLPEYDNNNHKTTLKSPTTSSVSHNQQVYLENKVNCSSGKSSPVTLNTAANPSPRLHSQPAISSESTDDGGLPIDCDIICNADGNIYAVPSEFSSRLLMPTGVLNVAYNRDVLPFPTSAKLLYFYSREAEAKQNVSKFVVSSFPNRFLSTSGSQTMLFLCLPCCTRFLNFAQFLIHGTTKHQLNSENYANMKTVAAAIIQQVSGQAASLHILDLDERLSMDSLLSKEHESSSGSSSRSSLITPPNSAGAFLPKPTSGGCDDHMDGSVANCHTCNLVLASRSLAGVWYEYPPNRGTSFYSVVPSLISNSYGILPEFDLIQVRFPLCTAVILVRRSSAPNVTGITSIRRR